MSRPFRLEITESEAELKKRLQFAREAIHKEKLQMLWWVKSGQVSQHQEIAERLGRNPSTITRWLQQYRRGGLAVLLKIRKAPGAVPKLNEAVVADLQQQLDKAEGFSSYGEVVTWLESKHGLTVKYATVYRWVRYRLGAKLKVPRPVSYRQDPQAVENFKKTLEQPSSC